MYRAVLEGIAYGIRHNIETFRAIGAPVKRAVAVGGGTKSTAWLQIISDVAKIEQQVPALTIGASYGDAFLAGLAAGILKREDLHPWVKAGSLIQPNAATADRYDALYADYRQLYESTKAIIHRLSV